MIKTKLPVFFAAPRSRSTPLLTLAAPYAIHRLGMHDLGYQTDFFQEYSSRYYQKDEVLNSTKSMEYFPLNRENAPITHHFVSPPIYKDKFQRDSHKLQVLNHEKKAGRHYLIKVMSQDLRRIDDDKKINKQIVDFFNDSIFVMTRRKDVKGLAFSLLVSYHTNLWHKRANNEDKYENLYDNPIEINPELCTIITPDLKSTALMDQVEDHIKNSGYTYHNFYYEDLTTLEDMKVALDSVFGNTAWREYVRDDILERTMTKPLNLDYSKIIYNYDRIEEKIDMMLKDIFG